jgi:hypothetical protein
MTTTIDLNLHPFQQAVYDSEAPNKVLEGARRLGKSRVALRRLQKAIVTKMPEYVSEHVVPPFHAWIVAPSFPQSNQVWTELLTYIPTAWMSEPPNQEYKRITLAGHYGGRSYGIIEVKSAHQPESLQTAGLDFLWVTEAQEFFKNIQDAISGDLLAGPMPGARYVAGLDLGRKHDSSVLWILDANLRKGVYHQRWDAGEDWSQQREGVVYACNQFGVDRLFVDATGMGGDMFYQALSEAAIPVEEYIFTEPTRMDLLNRLAIAMERHTVFFPAVPEIQREMRAYQFIKRGNGKPRPDHPEGEHDDEIMALGMALLLCEEMSPESPRRAGSGKMSYMANPEGHIGQGHQMQLQARRDRIQARWERSGITL